MSERWLEILGDPSLAQQLGQQGREHIIANSSLDSMTEGYASLVEDIFARKTKRSLTGAAVGANGK